MAEREFSFNFKLNGALESLQQLDNLQSKMYLLKNSIKDTTFKQISNEANELNNTLKEINNTEMNIKTNALTQKIKDVDDKSDKTIKHIKPISGVLSGDDKEDKGIEGITKEKRVRFKLFGLPEALKDTDDFDKKLKELKKNIEPFDSSLQKVGKRIEKIFNIKNNNLSNTLKELDHTFTALRSSGGGVFTSFNVSVKSLFKNVKGLSKALKVISAISLGGILLFLGNEALRNNIAGIGSMFSRLSAEISKLFTQLRIAVREILKSLEPFLKILVDIAQTFLMDLLRGVTKVLTALAEAPQLIKVITGALVVLGLVLWGISTAPIITIIAGFVAILMGLYKVLKWIIELFKSNDNLSMNVKANVSGYDFKGTTSDSGSTNINSSTDNSSRIITNNVYVQGTGYSRKDGMNIAEELSYMNSISKTM